jgi:hypothetical protein
MAPRPKAISTNTGIGIRTLRIEQSTVSLNPQAILFVGPFPWLRNTSVKIQTGFSNVWNGLGTFQEREGFPISGHGKS